jgi:hypothetical protein
LVRLYGCWASYGKEPTAQIAHLFFANTKANTEKSKELFFAHAYRELREPEYE